MLDLRTAHRIVLPNRGITARPKDARNVLILTSALILALGLPASAQYRGAPQPRDSARQATPTKKNREGTAPSKAVLPYELRPRGSSPGWKYHPKRSWKYRPKRSWTYRPKRSWKYHPRHARS